LRSDGGILKPEEAGPKWNEIETDAEPRGNFLLGKIGLESCPAFGGNLSRGFHHYRS
jgi:hypothetical protein